MIEITVRNETPFANLAMTKHSPSLANWSRYRLDAEFYYWHQLAQSTYQPWRLKVPIHQKHLGRAGLFTKGQSKQTPTFTSATAADALYMSKRIDDPGFRPTTPAHKSSHSLYRP
jgi:hypothetical protein